MTLLTQLPPSSCVAEYFDVGSYHDVVHNHDSENRMTFSFRLDDDDRLSEASEDDDRTPFGARELSLTFAPKGHEVELESYALADERGRNLFKRKRREDGSYDVSGSVWRDAVSGLGNSKVARDWRKLVRAERPVNFYFGESIQFTF